MTAVQVVSFVISIALPTLLGWSMYRLGRIAVESGALERGLRRVRTPADLPQAFARALPCECCAEVHQDDDLSDHETVQRLMAEPAKD